MHYPQLQPTHERNKQNLDESRKTNLRKPLISLKLETVDLPMCFSFRFMDCILSYLNFVLWEQAWNHSFYLSFGCLVSWLIIVWMCMNMTFHGIFDGGFFFLVLIFSCKESQGIVWFVNHCLVKYFQVFFRKW